MGFSSVDSFTADRLEQPLLAMADEGYRYTINCILTLVSLRQQHMDDVHYRLIEEIGAIDGRLQPNPRLRSVLGIRVGFHDQLVVNRIAEIWNEFSADLLVYSLPIHTQLNQYILRATAPTNGGS